MKRPILATLAVASLATMSLTGATAANAISPASWDWYRNGFLGMSPDLLVQYWALMKKPTNPHDTALGPDGANTNELARTFTNLQRFWDVDTSDVGLVSLDGKILGPDASADRQYVYDGLGKVSALGALFLQWGVESGLGSGKLNGFPGGVDTRSAPSPPGGGSCARRNSAGRSVRDTGWRPESSGRGHWAVCPIRNGPRRATNNGARIANSRLPPHVTMSGRGEPGSATWRSPARPHLSQLPITHGRRGVCCRAAHGRNAMACKSVGGTLMSIKRTWARGTIVALAGLSIAFAGAVASAPAAVAASSTTATAPGTYDVGVYLYPQCVAYGNYYKAYFASQGQRTYIQCLWVAGDPPLIQFLLRVTVLP
ncbi:hypothetical protein ACWCXX_26280 [Streptomyces sp. NPDC001732]